MSKRAISPCSRSGTKSSSEPLAPRWNVSNWKNCLRMSSFVRPIAFSSVVTGILRRRSTRKNRKSFGSNSKSSHEPRYGITRAENRSLPDECVLPRSCSKNTPGERWSCDTMTRSVPLMMNEPFSVMSGISPM